MSLFRKKPMDHAPGDDSHGGGLRRTLSALDLTLLGIGAIIGAGIFVLTGIAAAKLSGPAVVLSFVISGIACACAALSYAELAASVGGAGSAYGYGYVGLGELPAWVIGWLLILEYTVSVATVSVGWSGYMANGWQSVSGMAIPDAFLHGPFDTAHPGGLVNLPALLIIVVLGALLATGAKISAQFNAVVVFIKLVAITVFIVVASSHINPQNWHPFIPPAEIGPDGHSHFGLQGIVQGAARIFFAYIGFDAVSTAAEETRNPQRDLPIGILTSLAVCTVLYMVVSALLTGIVSYRTLDVPSPVASALLQVGARGAAGVVSAGAIAGLTTVMLTMYYALTRIFFAISRDGLLPQLFAKVSSRTRSPLRCIVLMGAIMALLGGFVPLDRLTELANIGTLGAFIVVCIGVIVLRRTHPEMKRPFRTPGAPLVPLIGVGFSAWLIASLEPVTWLYTAIWVTLGLLVYFGYSRRHSVLAAAS